MIGWPLCSTVCFEKKDDLYLGHMVLHKILCGRALLVELQHFHNNRFFSAKQTTNETSAMVCLFVSVCVSLCLSVSLCVSLCGMNEALVSDQPYKPTFCTPVCLFVCLFCLFVLFLALFICSSFVPFCWGWGFLRAVAVPLKSRRFGRREKPVSKQVCQEARAAKAGGLSQEARLRRGPDAS